MSGIPRSMKAQKTTDTRRAGIDGRTLGAVRHMSGREISEGWTEREGRDGRGGGGSLESGRRCVGGGGKNVAQTVRDDAGKLLP